MGNKFRMMLLSMATLGFFSCSDKLTEDNTQPQGEEADNYVVFKIGSIGSETRATPGSGDFDAGLAEEHAVSTKAGANVVYFFDENGNAIQSSVLEVLGQQENNNATDDDHNSSYAPNAQEKVYQARIKGTKETISKYTQCLIILNGEPTALDGLKETRLSDVLGELDEGMGWLTDGNTKYFTMSNTVYVDAELNVKSAEKINPEKQICTTMAEAQKNPIVVHVERVLAKFGLNKGSSDTGTTPITEATEIEPTPNEDGEGGDKKNLYITLMTSTKEESTAEETPGDDTEADNDDSESPDHYTEWVSSNRKWKVKIVGWGMNATETATYWFKNLKDKDEKTFDASTGKFGKYWTPVYDNDNNTIGWNDYARLRSYWAVDPHYNGNNDETSANYPHQYRVASDNDKIVSGSTANKLVLNYNYYNAFTGFPTKGYNYTVENTFDYEWFSNGSSGTNGFDFQGYDYKRTGTHAIVAAELLIANKEGDTPDSYSAQTVYQYDSYYWLADGTERYKDMPKSLKKYMLNQVLFHWSLENNFKDLCTDEECTKPLEANSKNFDNYFDVVAATLDGGDGRAMMKLKGTLYFKDKDGNIRSIVDAEGNAYIKNFKEKFLYDYGSARRFDGGKMYYYIPIKHMSADNALTSDKTAYQYNVGRYGVVRNHWYKLNINAIKNPGIPVDDPNQPIIPNDDPDEDYYAAFEIVILPWHVINNDVTFE